MNNSCINEYFAAANGYWGFRSYFPEIFNPREFSRLFIIKGGPGTGKSSLMRKIEMHGKARGYYTEKIYCSSDPKSLDGVIIESDKGRIGFLDGTAPHQTDAQYPGAVDEILNLADGFDIPALKLSREEIIELNTVKKEAYSDAYYFLSVAGSINNEIRKHIEKNIDYRSVRKATLSIVSKIKPDENHAKPKIKLVGAFSKAGYVNIFSDKDFPGKIINIGGEETSQAILMNSIYQYATSHGLASVVSPSALDEYEVDLIIANNLVIRKNNATPTCNAPDIQETATLRELKSLRSLFLEKAREKFNAASEAHFKIEDIYKNAVNFNHNDMLCKKALATIDSILQ